MSLVRLEDRAYVRQDYALDVWEPCYGVDAVAVWQTCYNDPKVAEEDQSETFSPLRRLFYDCAASSDRKDVAIAYLAAQLLRRQKVFRLLKESDGEDGEVRVALFSDRIGDRIIEVSDPTLSYAELEEAQPALMQRLAALETEDESKQEEAESAGYAQEAR